MRYLLSLLLVLVSAATAPYAEASGTGAFPGRAWTRATATESAGWSHAGLKAAHDYADTIKTASVMIIQHGRVVDQWGDVARKISSYSVRKSLISALYGIYADEGVIDPEQTLADAGIDDAPTQLTVDEKKARIVDLLRARSGIYLPVDFESPNQKTMRPARGSHPPGTFWFYNNWDFNALGTIFERKVGLPIGEAFYRRIATAIGMQEFQASDVYYISGPISIHRAYHFRISARDLARFGLLYLNNGRWGGKQVVPQAWIEKSTHAHEMVQLNGVDRGGYEYLWWCAYGGVHFPGVTVPDDTYSARGAGGHYLVVIPSLDLVIVHRFDNDPPATDPDSVVAAGLTGINDKQFGPLLKLILDARKR